MDDLSIISVKYISDYKIEIKFSDGKIQLVDFSSFLKLSNHPEISKYLDLEIFKKFKVIDGDLDWNDFDLTFPIWDLYQGQILKVVEGKGLEVPPKN